MYQRSKAGGFTALTSAVLLGASSFVLSNLRLLFHHALTWTDMKALHAYHLPSQCTMTLPFTHKHTWEGDAHKGMTNKVCQDFSRFSTAASHFCYVSVCVSTDTSLSFRCRPHICMSTQERTRFPLRSPPAELLKRSFYSSPMSQTHFLFSLLFRTPLFSRYSTSYRTSLRQFSQITCLKNIP